MPRKKNNQKKLHVKKGDMVALTKAITSAKGQPSREKGYQSRVLMVFPEQERVLVEGVNVRTKNPLKKTNKVVASIKKLLFMSLM